MHIKCMHKNNAQVIKSDPLENLNTVGLNISRALPLLPAWRVSHIHYRESLSQSSTISASCYGHKLFLVPFLNSFSVIHKDKVLKSTQTDAVSLPVHSCEPLTHATTPSSLNLLPSLSRWAAFLSSTSSSLGWETSYFSTTKKNYRWEMMFGGQGWIHLCCSVAQIFVCVSIC